MNRRKLIAGTVAALVSVSIVGCAGTPSASTTPGSTASSAAGGTITYWASNQGTSVDNDKEVLAPLIEDFTKKTGTKVNLEVIPWTDLQTRIQTAVTSGQGPDVVNIGNTWSVSLQATGAFQEFGDAEMKAIGGADKFVPSALATGGQAYTEPAAVPLYGLTYGLYYNKQMFADAGLTPPKTWEEMVTAAQKLTDTAKGVYGLTVAGGSYRMNAHLGFITSSQNGTDLFDGSGKPNFTQDAVADGILRYVNLMATDKVVNPSDSQLDSASKSMPNFAQHKAAMTIQQSNAGAVFIKNGMKDGEWGVVPLPAPSGAATQVGSHVAGINIAVFKNTKNKDAALSFVNYLTSPEAQSALGKPFSVLPVLQGVKATFTKDAEQAATFSDIYATKAKPLPLVPAEDQYEQTVGKAMNQMFASAATGKAVTKEDILAALQTAQSSIR